ncbi:MAG: tRNA (adenosine(37)-N6)-threonylcarbamoyltransferase complex transferase subunit TsaD [Bacteriovoracia bacterium]
MSEGARLILGIETSCDECSASVVERNGNGELRALSVSTFSQIAIHQPYGGVVPEIASRNHLETVNAMVDDALRDSGKNWAELDALAVTNRPGLVGALLVGVSAAKALAYVHEKPLIAVHHLEGHLASLFLDQPEASQIEYPLLLALVSGGHTNLYVIPGPPDTWGPDLLAQAQVGRSRDDAAGEAFDKTAKLMGFPYPGGIWIDRRSQGGDPKRYAFPRALPEKKVLDFSFSGLKTAVALEIQKLQKKDMLDAEIPHLCASIQEAIIDALMGKIELAAAKHRCRSLAFVGGVAANSRLRARLAENRRPCFFPKSQYCTDNAAMIAAAGAFQFQQGRILSRQQMLTLNAVANPSI